MILIPLRNGPENAHQKFSIRLGNNFLDFEVNFISYTGHDAWSMNIFRDGSPIVYGAMLECGADVIENYRAGIGKIICVGDDPTLDNLGIDNSLVWTAS